MDRTAQWSDWRARSAYEQTKRFERRLLPIVLAVLVVVVGRFI